MRKKRLDKLLLVRVYRGAALLSGVLSLVIAVSYFFAMRLSYNFEIMHFDSSVWFWTFLGAAVLSVLICTVLAVLSKGYNVSISEKRSLPESFGRMLGAATSAIIFVFFLKNKFLDHASLAKFSSSAGAVSVFIAAALVIGLSEKYRVSGFSSILHMVAVIAVVLRIFALYFDFSSPINAPVRNISIVMFCASLLVLLSETRLTFPPHRVESGAPLAAFAYFFASSVCIGFPVGALAFRAVSNTSADTNLPPVLLGFVLSVGIISAARVFSLGSMLCDPIPEEFPTDELEPDHPIVSKGENGENNSENN